MVSIYYIFKYISKDNEIILFLCPNHVRCFMLQMLNYGRRKKKLYLFFCETICIDDLCVKYLLYIYIYRCTGDIIAQCPAQLRMDGACNGPCPVLKTEEHCCNSGNCGPTPLSMFFKQRCPDAYSYPKDDPTSLFTCPSGTNYNVIFCPWMKVWLSRGWRENRKTPIIIIINMMIPY